LFPSGILWALGIISIIDVRKCTAVEIMLHLATGWSGIVRITHPGETSFPYHLNMRLGEL
jgi:hypothetical protein